MDGEGLYQKYKDTLDIKKLRIEEVPIFSSKISGGYEIEGYVWVKKEREENIKKTIQEHPLDCLCSYLSTNKGTIQTAEYIGKNINNKENLFLIWMYAFLTETERFYPDNWYEESSKLFDEVYGTITKEIQKRGFYWHHAMRTFIPEKGFSNYFLEHVNLDSKEVLMSLASISLEYVTNNYIILHYYTVTG